MSIESIILPNDEASLENRAYEDQRVQTIHLHNVTFAGAIRAGSVSSKTTKKYNA